MRAAEATVFSTRSRAALIRGRHVGSRTTFAPSHETAATFASERFEPSIVTVCSGVMAGRFAPRLVAPACAKRTSVERSGDSFTKCPHGLAHQSAGRRAQTRPVWHHGDLEPQFRTFGKAAIRTGPGSQLAAA